MIIYCCSCNSDIKARLTSGFEIYPHRSDLSNVPFWVCDCCGNFVGCHHKTRERTKPLGCIPTKEIRSARGHIHALLDPIWRSKKVSRSILYRELSKRLGYSYHTAEIRTIEQARVIYREILSIKHGLDSY